MPAKQGRGAEVDARLSARKDQDSGRQRSGRDGVGDKGDAVVGRADKARRVPETNLDEVSLWMGASGCAPGREELLSLSREISHRASVGTRRARAAAGSEGSPGS